MLPRKIKPGSYLDQAIGKAPHEVTIAYCKKCGLVRVCYDFWIITGEGRYCNGGTCFWNRKRAKRYEEFGTHKRKRTTRAFYKKKNYYWKRARFGVIFRVILNIIEDMR